MWLVQIPYSTTGQAYQITRNGVQLSSPPSLAFIPFVFRGDAGQERVT